MRTPVERLRAGLLAGAVLLVLVIAGFLGYARYRVHRALADLPGRLGATISKEFNGWTYSQSDGKKTIFTIHASKAVEHKDGLLTLHDVNMVLYGKKGDRADRISGDDFEYDTKNEMIRALGVVHLDLAAPVAEGTQTSEAAKHLGGAATMHEDAGANSKVIHVKTSGLVYMKKLGVAATAEGIEFAFGGFTGHAVGAEYDSDTGHLVFQSALRVSGLDDSRKGIGRPLAVTASHGEFDRAGEVAEFADARYNSGDQTAQADTARIHLRGDGTVERIEGERHVALAEAGKGTATSDRADLSLSTANRPLAAVLTGSVHFAEDEPLQVRGESNVAHLDFDRQGQLDHAVLHSHVFTSERQPGRVGAPWEERNLSANDLELTLVASGDHGTPLLREARAIGSAHLTTVATTSKAAKPGACGKQPVVLGKCFVTTTTKLSGDVIQAHLIAPHGEAELSSVHGAGHTIVEQHTSAGADQTSLGDSLDASFREVPGAINPAKAAVELATAVQQGGVAITRSLSGKIREGVPAPREIQHATARMASYDANAGTVTMTGEVRMSEAKSTITADRVLMERDSGNATADGAVKVTYLQGGPEVSGTQKTCSQKSGTAEPVHILASRAEFNQDDGRATFYGGPVPAASGGSFGLARLWQAGAAGLDGAHDAQGGSQIEAPVLVFEQEQRRLTARAEKAGVPGQVHAALAYTATEKPFEGTGREVKTVATKQSVAKQAAKGEAMPPRQDVVRISSSQMVYSDIERQAVFTGGVRLLDRHGDMRAQQATVVLRPASAGKDAASKEEKPAMNRASHAISDAPCSSGIGPSGADPSGEGMLAGAPGVLGGGVERIVATQGIVITQPGRKATGERLIYTAIDQMFVLTGTAAAPPKIVDAVQGTSTGAVVRFHFGDKSLGDDSVVVSGQDGDTPAQRIRTETRVKK